MGAIDEPSPVTSVVTPWVILLAARSSTRTLNSDWPSMSMKPGDTTRLRASIVDFAWRPANWPIAVMRSPVIPTSPRYHGAPVPSTMRPPVMRTSKASAGLGAVTDAGVVVD